MAAIQAAAAEPSAAKAAAAWETDMSIWNAIILGLVQGIAEFLPISSSGHLAILQNLMGLKTAEGGGYVFFDVLLHLGTLISICIVYWSEIVSMVRETVLFFKRSSTPEQKEHLPAARELLMIVIATLPLFLILPVKDKIEGLYYNTLFVGCALIATGAILFFSDRRKAPGKKGARSFSASVRSEGQPAFIEIRLDDPKAEAIGTLEVKETSGLFKTQTCSLKGPAGVHDLYLYFRGKTPEGPARPAGGRMMARRELPKNLLAIDWWRIK